MESGAQGAGAAGEQATAEMPPVSPEWAAPAASPSAAEADAFAQRPEIFVGAAFAGGLVLAQLLKRVGR